MVVGGVCFDVVKLSHYFLAQPLGSLSFGRELTILMVSREAVLSFEDIVEIGRIHRSFKPIGAGVVDASILYLAMQKRSDVLKTELGLSFPPDIRFECFVLGLMPTWTSAFPG